MKLGATVLKKLRRIFGKASPSLYFAGEEDYYRILHFAEGIERMRRIAAELPFPGSTHRKEDKA